MRASPAPYQAKRSPNELPVVIRLWKNASFLFPPLQTKEIANFGQNLRISHLAGKAPLYFSLFSEN
jgi:hypothetical protein